MVLSRKLLDNLMYWIEEEDRFFDEINFSRAFPNFDLWPHDYIGFAEEELRGIKEGSDNTRLKINTILHLKRALNCQLDVLFCVFSLEKYISRKNLGLNKKLEFVSDLGLIRSRVIKSFSKVRNRVEHDYKIPEIVDVEVYFDLILSLVINIERVVYSSGYKSYFKTESMTNNKSLNLAFKRGDIPSFKLTIEGSNKKEVSYEVSIRDNLEDFSFLFKVFLFFEGEKSILTKTQVLNELENRIKQFIKEGEE